METWRVWIIVILMSLSLIDLGATYFYVSKYKVWQPDKPFNLIENNPLLVFLWNNFGLHLGMFIGTVIILSLIFVVGKSAHPIVSLILFLFLGYALQNHYANINLLQSLIEKYPSGHLDPSIFGEVIGSNPK